MTDIVIKPYEEDYFASYVKFAQQNWGNLSYQSTRDYISWLYEANFAGEKKPTDFLLAVLKSGDVVGVIHKMRFNWQKGESVVAIPAVHNLMVAPGHQHGTGLRLILASIAGEQHALLPGARGPLADFYGKILKCQKVDSYWYRKILAPVRGCFSYLSNKFIRSNTNVKFILDGSILVKNKLSYNLGYTISLAPSSDVIDRMIDSLNNREADTIKPYWTKEQFIWRFMHHSGTKHLFIYKESIDRITDFIIISLGPYRGFNVARLIEISTSSTESLQTMIGVAEKIIKIFGGHILLIFSSNKRINQMFQELKIKTIKNMPTTFFYHKKRNECLNYDFNGSPGDFGFESILSQIREQP